MTRPVVVALSIATLAWPTLATAQAERRCYFVDGEVLTAGASLELLPSGELAGALHATVHDDANGYYTSYSQDVLGSIEGSEAAVRVTTWIEYDVQDSDESWTVGQSELVTPQGTLARTACETLDETFAGMGFADAFTVEGDAGYPWHFRRVIFAPGFSTATYRSGVVRGERDVYLLRARAGQVLTLWIDAVEDNAVFDLVSPDGQTLVQESRETRFEIPDHGEYQIIVGGTRGNAGYELVIALR